MKTRQFTCVTCPLFLLPNLCVAGPPMGLPVPVKVKQTVAQLGPPQTGVVIQAMHRQIRQPDMFFCGSHPQFESQLDLADEEDMKVEEKLA